MQPEQINFCQTGKSYKVVIAKQCFEKLIKSLIRKVRFAKNNEAKKYKKTFYLTTINVCITIIFTRLLDFFGSDMAKPYC
jgi:hypothetical protein